jgi:GMP reductase
MRSLTYDDVALVPEYFGGSSRSNLSTVVHVADHSFRLPVIPANMRCVINEDIAIALASSGYFYVMHRFDVNIWKFVERCFRQGVTSSISLGVQPSDKSLVDAFAVADMHPDFITIDIAHGHCSMMRDMIAHIKSKLTSFVVAGNICTLNGYDDLSRWGADAVKVGVGPGQACTTRLKTGFYSPMFSTIQQVAQHRVYNKTYIIADGGIQHNGDIAKALVAGADMVMVGGMFAQCVDSPADSVNGEKVYFGSASAENKGHSKNIEGRKVLMHNNGMTYRDKLVEIEQDLQSAMSYAGGTLSTQTKYIEV